MINGRPVKISKNNSRPSSVYSKFAPPELRYLIFKGFNPPPLPSPPAPPSITVPRRPSYRKSQIIVPHDRFRGVYVSKDRTSLYTKNLVPNLSNDGDVVVSVKVRVVKFVIDINSNILVLIKF